MSKMVNNQKALSSNGKKRYSRSTILRLGKYLFYHKGLLSLALICTLGSNLFSLIGPRLTGYAIGAIEPGKGAVDFETVWYYAAWMAGFYVVSAAMSYGLQVLMLTISRKVVYRMRQDVFEKLMTLPVGYFDVHQTGDIISRISYDIDTVNASLSNDLVQLLTTVITVAGALIMMFTISPKLLLVFAFTVPLSVFMTKTITGKTRPLFRERSAKLGEMNGFVEEMISGQKTLKAYGREDYTIERFDKKNKAAVDAYYRAEYYGSIVGPCVNFVNNLSLSLISVFGALLYLAGSMSIGDISSFVLYSRKFSGPINEAANIMSELQSALAAAERVFRLLEETPESEDAPDAVELGAEYVQAVNKGICDGCQGQQDASDIGRLIQEDAVWEELNSEKISKEDNNKEAVGKEDGNVETAYEEVGKEYRKDSGIIGDVRMNHIDFGYLPGKPVIHDLSFHASPGQLIAIVGPTGAGKTTLINLLMRFYDPNAGEIQVDGREIRTLTRKSLRKAYAMVLQDTWLFYGTIYENLAYGKEDAAREEVERAAKAAHIHSFIKRLPQGYDTILTDEGTNISKGQKQLLTIARAMLLDAKMLILDEATSNVDTRTEQQIQKAMRKLMEHKTCFVIAHRLSTIQNADLILVVNGGEVVEQGTHRELMERGGMYRQLYEAQFE